ncbi:MAG TPA: protein kinase [Spirosoma sp.]|nr:protein kinase [Spirosoma sp.]
MGRLFTIAEGLENMGALRTGGQGSVYKGRRTGEIFTAVKILPTPIHTESIDDKNFRDFQNEVEKLKKVNEVPNPNVVKILNSGITESGSFPFIEMEFIEGPDLEELLKPPHDPVFSIREVIKVADQLASALAHCHKVGVRHGDIKSNNVKFNSQTGNYVLLDFGLAAMSDEQRRTSLRHAGAIEFMAPEQNEGLMLFQTDVYSYGIILYELIAGTVPFPLRDKGETTRNAVMVSHLETPVPDVLARRSEHLPDEWPDDRKKREMQVPAWLLSILTTCLEKKPENRFRTGVELHEAIIQGSTLAVKSGEEPVNSATVLQGENGRLLSLVRHYQERAIESERTVSELRALLAQQESEPKAQPVRVPAPPTIPTPVQPRPVDPSATLQTERRDAEPVMGREPRVRQKKTIRLAGLVLLIGLGAWAAYSRFGTKSAPASDQTPEPITDTRPNAGNNPDEREVVDAPVTQPDEHTTDALPAEQKVKPIRETAASAPVQTAPDQELVTAQKPRPPIAKRDTNVAAATPTSTEPTADELLQTGSTKRYTLASRYAYFHNEPDPSTRRAANINIWNNARLTPLAERNGFIYVVYVNERGQTSRGWLLQKDLKLISK